MHKSYQRPRPQNPWSQPPRLMDYEHKLMRELQQVNFNISVYKRLINNTTLNEAAKRELMAEVVWLENNVIPQLTIHDV